MIVVGVVAVLLLVATIALVSTLRYGFSAHDEPTLMERTVARTMRHWAAPSDLRDRQNPIPLTPDVLAEARISPITARLVTATTARVRAAWGKRCIRRRRT